MHCSHPSALPRGLSRATLWLRFRTRQGPNSWSSWLTARSRSWRPRHRTLSRSLASVALSLSRMPLRWAALDALPPTSNRPLCHSLLGFLPRPTTLLNDDKAPFWLIYRARGGVWGRVPGHGCTASITARVRHYGARHAHNKVQKIRSLCMLPVDATKHSQHRPKTEYEMRGAPSWLRCVCSFSRAAACCG